MTNKIKVVKRILIITYVILMPALLISCFAIFMLALNFEDVREFSDESDLTYLLSGKELK